MFRAYKIKFCAIVCFLFLILFSFEAMAEKARDADAGPLSKLCPDAELNYAFGNTMLVLVEDLQDCLANLDKRIEELQSQLDSASGIKLPNRSISPLIPNPNANTINSNRRTPQINPDQMRPSPQINPDQMRPSPQINPNPGPFPGRNGNNDGRGNSRPIINSEQRSLSPTSPPMQSGIPGSGDGELPQDLGATANEDMLREQCQKDHGVCMRRAGRIRSKRMKAKARRECNQARIGPSGQQGTCR